MTNSELPEALARIRQDFLELEQSDRLTLLLEFANELPELPSRYADHPDLLERVVECQSPVFIFVDVEPDRRVGSSSDESSGDESSSGVNSDAKHDGADQIVHLHATAPRESPTTRGFASILAQGLAGLTTTQVLDVPDDFANTIGLTQAVSPLRIRGMTALLARTKRQVREKIGA